MTLKETLIENLSKITSGMKQKEIAKIMGCTEGTISKYLNKNKKDFPTVEMLHNLSKYFNVSIDWLIGNSDKKNIDSNLSPRDVCKMLLSIYESHRSFSFGQYTVTEDCYEPEEYNGQICKNAECHQKNNTYIALYFSEWFEICEDDSSVYAWIGNYSYDKIHINKFLSRLNEVTDMLKRGNLTKEMYNRLLDSYLNDVPD